MLHEFVLDLRRLPPLARSTSDMAKLLTGASAAGEPGIRLARRADSYARTCVYRDDRFEVLLLDWAAGSVSSIHDHGGRHCWLTVLGGRLRVDDYERLDTGSRPGRAWLAARESRALETGGLDLRSGPFDLHRVTALEHAVSLHVYARPLDAFLIYDERAHRCSRTVATDDAQLDLLAEASR